MVAHTAAEIVAWKVPLRSFSGSFETKNRLENAPEPLPFFRPGDVLWNAGLPRPPLPAGSPEVEWAVWNETTTTLVTKSSTDDLWKLHRFLRVSGVDRFCKLRLEVFETTGDGLVARDSKPSMNLEFVFESGARSRTVKATGKDGTTIDADAEGWANVDSLALTLYLTCGIPGQSSLGVNTSVVVKNGVPVWIASDADGRSGAAIRVTAWSILADGSPAADLVKVQDGNQVRRPTVPNPAGERIRVSEKLWLYLKPWSLKDYFEMRGIPFPGKENPFDRPFDVWNEVDVTKLKAKRAPGAIHEWICGPFFDLSGFLNETGFILQEGRDVGGFCPLSQAVFLLTGSETEADKFEQLTSTLDGGPPFMIGIELSGSGRTRLLGRRGRMQDLYREDGKGSIIRRFTVEPLYPADNDLIDLSFSFDESPHSESSDLISTKLPPGPGHPVEVKRPGDRKPVTLEGVIVRPFENDLGSWFTRPEGGK